MELKLKIIIERVLYETVGCMEVYGGNFVLIAL